MMLRESETDIVDLIEATLGPIPYFLSDVETL